MHDFGSGRAYISKRCGDSVVNLEYKSKKKIKSSRITNFALSMNAISRIVKVILENDSLGRTALSQEANINYTTLSKHLDWLKKKSIVEYVVDDGKVIVRLTTNGREFALQLSKLTLQ